MDLLNKIGRGAEKRLTAQGESWEALNAMWLKGRNGIKDSGLGVKDRRYVVLSAGLSRITWTARLRALFLCGEKERLIDADTCCGHWRASRRESV